MLRATVDVLAGHRSLAGSTPYSHCYGGHQFGSWAGQLGDGRAISLGHVVVAADAGAGAGFGAQAEADESAGVADGTLWELSLKGAGRTPFSRRGDGRAVLQSVRPPTARFEQCQVARHTQTAWWRQTPTNISTTPDMRGVSVISDPSCCTDPSSP